jgi:Flp pilus assembly protein TadD
MGAASSMKSPGQGARGVVVARCVAGACLALLGVVAAGCRSLSPATAEGFELASALRARGLDPASVLIPWQINVEMRKWVRHEVPDNLAAEDRLQRLMNGLLGSGGLALEYKAGTTTTAQEAFASRQANCLAFTSLFVGLAREVGVPVFYLDVGDVEKFERDGNLVVESGHITAGYGSGSLLRILEFTPVGTPSYRQLHLVSDLTAIALFYSNRGAELLRAGKEQEALTWLVKAVAVDPELARAWINYGVALRRTGDVAGAEKAYRKALEDDPSAVAAYQNLAAVLFASGHSREADELLSLSSKLDSRNPFNYLSLGDVAMRHGRTEEARGFYRKAARLEGAAAESEAALGQLALATGDRRGARRWLHKAVARDGGNERVQRLAAQLGEAVSRPRAATGRNEGGPRANAASQPVPPPAASPAAAASPATAPAPPPPGGEA